MFWSAWRAETVGALSVDSRSSYLGSAAQLEKFQGYNRLLPLQQPYNRVSADRGPADCLL